MKTAVTALLVGLCVVLVLGGAAYAQDAGTKKTKADDYYNTAKELFDRGHYKAAEQSLALALEADPDHARAKALLAEVKKKLRAAPAVDPVVAELLRRERENEEAKRQHARLLAEHYYKTGKKRFDEGLYSDAEKNLSEAVRVNPRHQKAKALLKTVRQILGKTTAEGNLIDLHRRSELVKWHYDKAMMIKLIADAKQLLQKKQYAAALEALDTARDKAKLLSRYTTVRRELAEINSLTDQAHAATQKAAKEAAQRKLAAARKLAEYERGRLAELHQQRIQRLFDDAKQRFKETRYLLAAAKCNEILKMDPTNKEVIAFRDKCYQAQHEADRVWYERTKLVETDKTWRLVRKLAIPFTEVQPLYPDNWDEIVKRTAVSPFEEEAAEEEAWKKPLLKALEEKIAFDFIATPLDDVVAFLRNLTKQNIVIDKNAVKDRDNLDITLKLDDVPLKDALSWILRLVNLNYTLENGAIYISTKEAIEKAQKTVIRYYDVTDLTVEIRDFKPNLQAISNEGLDDENVDDIFGGDDDDDDDKADTFTGDSLVEFIKRVIEPGSWDKVPGEGGDLGGL